MTTTSTAPAPAMAMETKPRPWWMTLISGIAALVIGGILLWAPAKTKADTYQLLVFFLGFYWVISGILDIVHIFFDHTAWGWKLFMGIVSIIAGGYILMYPMAAGIALPRIFVLVLGLWGLFYGVILLIMAFRGGGWAAGILGVLGLIFGGLLIADYGSLFSGLAMIWAAAFMGVFGGIVLIVQSFMMRSAQKA